MGSKAKGGAVVARKPRKAAASSAVPVIRWEAGTGTPQRAEWGSAFPCLLVRVMGCDLAVQQTHVSPATPIARWTINDVDGAGSHACIDSRESEEEARSAVEAAVAEAHATGRGLIETIVARANAARFQESIDEACEGIADLARGNIYGPKADDEATALERDLFGPGLEAFLAKCRAAGWTVTAEGRVVQTWRERANGAWVDTSDIELWHQRGRGTHWLRVEAGIVCEVWQGGMEGQEDREWSACVDGTYVDLESPESAKAWAIGHARRVAKAGAPKSKPKRRAS